MNKFICNECGTKYSSPETTPPPGIKWNDGHTCSPTAVKDPKDPEEQDDDDMDIYKTKTN